MDRFLSKPALRGRGRLIPPGVDISVYSPDVPPRLGVRERLGIGPEAVVVACVAQLVPVKGHPTLIRAVARHPGMHLWLAANNRDREYAESLEALIRELGLGGRVHLLGGVADVPALLAEADVFALPTWAKWRMEGCPIALLEAMACAKACVATEVPGSRDVIVNGANGLLVRPEDVDSLAQALGVLASSTELRRSLGAAARRRILENYTLDREVRQYQELYSEIMS
jgi:glycosyltransferase involved in cell wall biosynthesis